MIDAEERTGQIYDDFDGTENDLNHVLSTFVDSELAPGNPTLWRGVPVASIQKAFGSSGRD